MASIIKLCFKALEAMRLAKIFDLAKPRNQSGSMLLLVSYHSYHEGVAFKGLELLGVPACHGVSKQGHMLPS